MMNLRTDQSTCTRRSSKLEDDHGLCASLAENSGWFAKMSRDQSQRAQKGLVKERTNTSDVPSKGGRYRSRCIVGICGTRGVSRTLGQVVKFTMILIGTRSRLGRQGTLGLLCCLALAAVTATPASAGEPPLGVEPTPNVLSRDAAIRWALANNPEIAAIRQQHGIAAASVVIAHTYPFNPAWTNKLFATNGPAADVKSRVAMEQRVSLDLEIRGQGKHRRQAASAGLSRADWEIAFQEELLAVRVLRAFNAAVYQRDKVRLAEETVELSEKAANSVRDLVQQGRLRPADLIVARTEVDDTRALLGSLRVAERKANQDLRRALGVTEESFTLQGTLDPLPPPASASVLRAAALERRPDLHARQAALAEADARVRLTIADRWGNPNIGPDYEYNETRVNFIGAQLVVPLPVLNTRKGEILQREAERTQAALNLRQTEVLIHQDVDSALSRLESARHWVETYRTEVLPNLQNNLADLEQLFLSGEPGVDVLRVINVRRKLLTARDGNLNALYELSQAQADLAAAVADPTLAIESGPSTVAPPTGPARP